MTKSKDVFPPLAKTRITTSKCYIPLGGNRTREGAAPTNPASINHRRRAPAKRVDAATRLPAAAANGLGKLHHETGLNAGHAHNRSPISSQWWVPEAVFWVLCELRSLSAKSNIDNLEIGRKTGYTVFKRTASPVRLFCHSTSTCTIRFQDFKISDGKGFIPRSTPHLVGFFQTRKPGACPFGTAATGPPALLACIRPTSFPAFPASPAIGKLHGLSRLDRAPPAPAFRPLLPPCQCH